MDNVIRKELEKYASQNVEPPAEVADQVEMLKGIEKEVAEKAAEKEQEMLDAKMGIQEFHTNVQRLQDWMQMAESQLQEPIGNLRVSQSEHEVCTMHSVPLVMSSILLLCIVYEHPSL